MNSPISSTGIPPAHQSAAQSAPMELEGGRRQSRMQGAERRAPSYLWEHVAAALTLVLLLLLLPLLLLLLFLLWRLLLLLGRRLPESGPHSVVQVAAPPSIAVVARFGAVPPVGALGRALVTNGTVALQEGEVRVKRLTRESHVTRSVPNPPGIQRPDLSPPRGQHGMPARGKETARGPSCPFIHRPPAPLLYQLGSMSAPVSLPPSLSCSPCRSTVHCSLPPWVPARIDRGGRGRTRPSCEAGRGSRR